MKAIINGRFILPDAGGDFCLREKIAMLYEGTIKKFLPADAFRPAMADETIDAAGNYVSPGFINVHIHGCAGKDTMDEDGEALKVIGEFQARSGVTAFLPTTMTYDMPRIQRALGRIRAAMAECGGARILGAHMEGPFISPAYKGAQAAQNIRPADFSAIEKYCDVIKIITIAPEELSGEKFIAQCRAAGIVVSLGHSAADYSAAMAAIDAGAGHITHLFNAQSAFHHRHPGLVGAALDSAANCELIADNIHAHPAAQRLAYRLKGRRRLVLITDSMRACGLGDGAFDLGGQAVTVVGHEARLADGTIAGSVITLDRAIANFRQNTAATISGIVEMVTKTPAQELGLYGKLGSLTVGKLADFTVFDEGINIKATYIGGQPAKTVCPNG